MGNSWLSLAVALAWPILLTGGAAPAGEAAASGPVILDTKSFWRFRTVWETPEVVLPSGEVKHARVVCKDVYGWFQKNPKEGQAPESMYKIEDVPTVRLPAETPADWMKTDFDDSAWARVRGPMLDGSSNEAWKLVLMRGLFEVSDPGKAGDLSLALTFRGGAAVYLNGEELTRASMPKGETNLYTPAEPYPEEVYFSSEGFALSRRDGSADGKPRIAKRVRQLADCKLPAAKLRKGTNVLAIAIHRAPTLARVYASRNKGGGDFHGDCYWAKIGLFDV